MPGSERPLDDITGEIIDASIRLHKALRPGLLESVYEVVLARDIERRGPLANSSFRLNMTGPNFVIVYASNSLSNLG